ncbi:hypothetical protein [Microbacterium elymi]|uniref:Transketolase N-terminal domain-containing protein n=1 Tax=Microbacterium elymi TaxID=2909587 RepID=A0ABY5NKJ8_9MICO|nr:hypothetical protein [Microbacterium elymi]UUT35680.1 hypothetical protein L2X98_20735 [Microbacterium elymi]
MTSAGWPHSCGSIRCGRRRRRSRDTRPRACRPPISWRCLLARHLEYDWHAPNDRDGDHLIFSKGHASPLLYSIFKAAGVIDDDELVHTYRQFGSRLQGHPTPVLPWVDVATGSLGQGCRSAWVWPGSPTGWRSATITSGCCAATASSPRARCGRRWRPPAASGWPG